MSDSTRSAIAAPSPHGQEGRTPERGEMTDILDAERPSEHGRLLGSALSLLAMRGRRDAPMEIPPECGTCAFKPGTLPNEMAGTGMIALNCVLGIDPDRFACHHGMKDGEPARLCVGYIAARLAPWSFTKEVVTELHRALGTIGEDDAVRASFDAWARTLPEDARKDVYQLAKDWRAHKAALKERPDA